MPLQNQLGRLHLIEVKFELDLTKVLMPCILLNFSVLL
jgi:hypothetical protein